MKTCFRCERVLPLDEFYVHSQMADGRLNYCKACVRERTKAHSRTEHAHALSASRYQQNRAKGIVKAGRWSRAHPERAALHHKASRAVTMAIRAGRLVPSQTCEQCGAPDKPIEAAHESYANALDVRWLCRACHRQWDAVRPKTIDSAELQVVQLEINGIVYRAIFETDPRINDPSPRWVIYGNHTRFRAVEQSPGVFTIVSDRVAGNIKPLHKGPLQDVVLVQDENGLRAK